MEIRKMMFEKRLDLPFDERMWFRMENTKQEDEKGFAEYEVEIIVPAYDAQISIYDGDLSVKYTHRILHVCPSSGMRRYENVWDIYEPSSTWEPEWVRATKRGK